MSSPKLYVTLKESLVIGVVIGLIAVPLQYGVWMFLGSPISLSWALCLGFFTGLSGFSSSVLTTYTMKRSE